jgi:phosphoribosylaminoimidazole-succinocarboxamide synthase
MVGGNLISQVREASLQLYTEAADYALKQGIIIADTKFEFGLDENDQLVLIDEILSPDSSRFWAVDSYQKGISPPSFDKQFIRDYLETLDWDKTAPGPTLPIEILEKSAAKYQQVADLLLDGQQA